MNFDSVIFDMDGVLISNDSYNQAIIKTVNFFIGNKLKRIKLATLKEISALKKISGFNNDWDLSFALISLKNRNVSIQNFQKEVFRITPSVRRMNQYIETKDIFQSYYLGKKMFQKAYKKEPPIIINKGLIQSEKRLLKINILKALKRKYKLAIATSRPKFEALYASRIQKISPGVIPEKFIVAKEDCKREKPFPDPLLIAQKRINAKNAVYIGDTINDCIAAKSAGMICIYIGNEKLGNYQFYNVNKIKEVLI